VRVSVNKQKVHPDGSKVVHSERKFGEIKSRVSLPPSTDILKLDAVLEEGVLTLTIPVSERLSE
jgi:HSP20 family molecular chaperone IbpA